MTASLARALPGAPAPPRHQPALDAILSLVGRAARRHLHTVALPFVPCPELSAALHDLGYLVTHHPFNPEDRFRRISPWVVSWTLPTA